MRGQLRELREECGRLGAELRQVQGEKEAAVKDKDLARGTTLELREQVTVLQDSLKDKQSEHDQFKTEIDKANGQLAELETFKSQLSELREILAQTAAALKETEAGKIAAQKEMQVFLKRLDKQPPPSSR